ncbi:hypothetical protein BHE74_00022066 [Ensete ventricosum]|nr:hypothetical protein BHE74_00022066 [Ensete ventricosum]
MPPTGSFHPQSQIPVVPMGPPPQGASQLTSRSNMPQPLESSLSASMAPSRPSLHGYSNVPSRANMPPFQPDTQFHASRSLSQPLMQAFSTSYVAPVHGSPYHTHQSLVPSPPPIGGPLSFGSREQLQHPIAGPPMGGLQGLVEEFESLTVGSVPGALDPGIDTKLLPRPLSGDEESAKILEMYPLNSHPRILRLTTHAIPNSQSLLSRWHLPLGAVVHPLAEAPDKLSFSKFKVFSLHLCTPLLFRSDASGRRCDLDQRPELCKGSVEFVASTEYMVRPPMPPLYFFLIDVSVPAVHSGLLEGTANVESASGPALRAAFMVMSALPSLGVGRLRLSGDDLRVYGTDKEHTLRLPEDPFYKQMAAEFTETQIAVDIYAFSEKYSDIASLGDCSNSLSSGYI